MDAIKTVSLTKYYGKRRGILDVNLTVEEGDFFGFIGPNGAGKSTTIRSLLGLIAPSEGQIQIFGKALRQGREELLSEIGYMPSEAAFYPNLKVEEVIRLSASLRKKDCRDRADQLCRRLELDPSVKIRELSMGNRKKVSIVCALQADPRLCILDEPTNGLDPLMQREFYEILRERNGEGTTIFLSSHVLSEVQRYCRHAAVIREGRLLAEDSLENLAQGETKRVILRGVEAAPELEGIRDVKAGSDGLSFLYRGRADRLLKALAALPVTDVQITEPDLEEVFMHFYKEETDNDAAQA